MRTIHYIPSAHTLNERAPETGPMKSSAVRAEVVWLRSQQDSLAPSLLIVDHRLLIDLQSADELGLPEGH